MEGADGSYDRLLDVRVLVPADPDRHRDLEGDRLGNDHLPGGLNRLDPSLYEAAKIDGAGPVKRIFHITLPGISSIIVFLFTIQIGSILYAGGEQVLLFYNPVTYSVGDIIDTWIYRQGVAQLQYSMATAMSLFQSFFGLLLVLAANKAARKYAGTGIW